MRAYAGLVAAIALSAWSCGEVQGPCLPGNHGCECVEAQCNAGLTCVTGKCFDLSSWSAGSTTQPSSDPTLGMAVLPANGTANMSAAGCGAAQASAAGSGANQASAAGDGAAQASAAGSVSADCGTNPAIATGIGTAGQSAASAGIAAAACAAVGGDCTLTPCCSGSVCAANVCVAAPQCSAPGADCAAQGCCDGVACVNNVCAAVCSLPQDCASNCCLALSPGASNTCSPAQLCQPPTAGASAAP